MMEYQLTIFEQLTIEILPETINSDNLKKHLELAKNEKDRICNHFRRLSYLNDPSFPLVKIIHTHQLGIVAISNEIFSHIGHTDYPVAGFYGKICMILEDILTFIRLHIPDHFDQDFLMTNYSLHKSRASISHNYQQLIKIHELLGIEKALVHLALQPIREFAEAGSCISYRELEHLKELEKELAGLLEMNADLNETIDYNYEMHSILLQLNFNFPRYTLYCCYRLDEKLSMLPSQAERMEKITWYIGMLTQIEHRPNFQFMQMLPSATQQILTSIHNAYHYILPETRDSNKGDHEKIRLSISVSVLALFLKILIRAKIIINNNNAEVFRIIADAFATPRSEKLSPESVKGKFNKTPMAAYRSIGAMFVDLMSVFRNV